MYADAMTKKNGNVPLLQMLMRIRRICITEESVTLEKHKVNPSSRSSSSKTRADPLTQAVMDARPKLIVTCSWMSVSRCEEVTQDEVVCKHPPCQ